MALESNSIRLALRALAASRSTPHLVNSTYPRRIFLDLPDVWESPWNADDFENIFEIMKWNATPEESIVLMKIIHQKKGLEQYPGGDCWKQVLAGLNSGRDVNTLQKAIDAWSLMRYYGTSPTRSTFNALFEVLCPFPEAINIIVDVYQKQMLASDCLPDHITLKHLLEAYMTQTPSDQTISEGNVLFERLLDLKASASFQPGYWDPIVKWMLFRSDSLALIKHTMYEQTAALGRISRTRPGDVDETVLAKTIPDKQASVHVTATLNQLVDLALRIGNTTAADIIYRDFFPDLGVLHTADTDELRLEFLLQEQDAKSAKSLYDDLQHQGQAIRSTTAVRLIQLLAKHDRQFIIETQSVFFDLLDSPDCPPETYSTSFAVLTDLLLRTEDYPRMRQTLQDRYIDRVPNWKNTLSSICLNILSDPKTAWLEPLLPVYHIVQRWAPNTITLSHHHSLMQKLISHGRTDLGLELFHDMRHSDISQPNRETYSLMLSGCAKTRDAQALEHIHNALRLDSSIEPDTDLFNSLMLAYNRSRLPEKALAIWEVLSESSKLPDVETASLALDACVRLPRYGLLKAREIWTFMENNKIEPASSSYAALLAVFASVGKWDGMLGLLERMDRQKVDARVLGTAFNCMRRDRKEEVELWAKENKPDVWNYLENVR
jgi:pentatricopeptide repeat protein